MLIFPRRCACWPIERGSPWKARRPRPCPAGAVEDRALRGQRLGGRGLCQGSCESTEVLDYIERRGLTRQSVERFRLGYAPDGARLAAGTGTAQAIQHGDAGAGGPGRPSRRGGGLWRERFRGRLIFPIHDDRGRTIGFGGRILPEVERTMAAQGKHVAKYLNSPETPLFHKRTILYAADLARNGGPRGGLGGRGRGIHRRDRGPPGRTRQRRGHAGNGPGRGSSSGAAAAGRSGWSWSLTGIKPGNPRRIGLWSSSWASELDLRVLTLPANLDPCDFLLKEGAEAFRSLAERAVDPLAYLLTRAAARFDLDSVEGSRRAAEWVLGILSRVPADASSWGSRSSRPRSSTRCRIGSTFPWKRSSGMRRQLRRPRHASATPAGSLPGRSVLRRSTASAARTASGTPSRPRSGRPNSTERPRADPDRLDRAGRVTG